MESGFDASSTVGNQSLETRESVQHDVPSLDQQIYHHQQQQQQQHHQHQQQQHQHQQQQQQQQPSLQQQLQHSQHQIQNQFERPPMEIPAAKVRSSLAELELQASQAVQRLETIKLSPNPEVATASAFKTRTSSTTGLLANDRHAPTDVLSFLESIIVANATEADENDEIDITEPEYLLPALNEVSHLALVSHSIIAYLSHLDYRKLTRITAKISGDTNRWLAHLFRFIDANASYHVDSTDAILRAVRLAIVTRCPGYLEGGVPALANPCLYICENSSQIALQYACRQLGLPVTCIRLVPASTTFAAFGTMDISALQKLIANDVATNRAPLFVMGDVGASICGHVDNVQRLQEVCRANSIWLHCRGHSLAALVMTQGTLQNDGQNLQPIADSMSLNLGSWLALPNLPVVLLHRQIESSALSAIDADPILSRRLTSLSLWTSLQAFGRVAIAGRIAIAFECCRMVYKIVSKCQGIRVLSKAPGSGTNLPISDLIYKPLNVSLLFEHAVPVVVFQFDGSSRDILPQQPSPPPPEKTESKVSIASQNISSTESIEVSPTTPTVESAITNTEISVEAAQQTIINKSIEKVANFAYFDKLNSWLGQNLQRECPDVSLEIREHPIHGTCIRFCPLELGLADTAPSIEQLELLEDCLDNQIDILRATVKHKATLNRLVEQSNVLRLVPLYDWAGLGGVRFVPEGWETWLTDQAKTELNKLNTDLVDSLRATDNAFSLGEGADGLICVRFGMVTEDTDVEELLDLVISVGRSVQENSRVLDTMSEIVKKGIETATSDLQRESDEKLWSDGIFRHVPVVGSVVNWWSPPSKETGIKGRSLNLTQGVVESTENIYKYHMQLSNDGKPQIQGTTKMTPQPMVCTSVSSGHSRQSSATSTTTHYDQPNPPIDITASTKQANTQ